MFYFWLVQIHQKLTFSVPLMHKNAIAMHPVVIKAMITNKQMRTAKEKKFVIQI